MPYVLITKTDMWLSGLINFADVEKFPIIMETLGFKSILFIYGIFSYW